uniref:Uncharacterized protein n=1 Tax=Arundo donax TaxID=35708 RepID=A0A0A9G236_ARUDO
MVKVLGKMNNLFFNCRLKGLNKCFTSSTDLSGTSAFMQKGSVLSESSCTSPGETSFSTAIRFVYTSRGKYVYVLPLSKITRVTFLTSPCLL